MKFSLPTLLNGQVVRLLIAALLTGGAAQAQNTFPATGNVGIGTTAPAYKLTVTGSNPNIGLDNTTHFAAKNSNGLYELAFIPRWTDNSTYLQYGAGGLVIRNNSNVAMIQANHAGRVGIGTDPTDNATLTVKGSILTEQVRVRLQANWPDYVFAPSYRLAPLAEVEQYIRTNGHLPNVPSAAQVEKEGGVELGAMNAKLLEKVEELTLYLIEEKKAREKEVAELKAELNQLKGAGNRK